MSRPTNSNKWTQSSDMDIYLKSSEGIEYTNTNNKGYPLFTQSKNMGMKCTVILGKKEINSDEFNNRFIIINQNDQIWTSVINYRGNLSSIGLENANKPITIIIHN